MGQILLHQRGGGPKTNGLNHCEVELNGRMFVVVPGDPIFKLKRAETYQAELRQKVGASDGNPLGATSVDEAFVALSASMMGPVATGTRMSLVELL